jgi:hypothetical protein
MFCISEARLLKLIATAMRVAGLTAAQAQTVADRSAQKRQVRQIMSSRHPARGCGSNQAKGI